MTQFTINLSPQLFNKILIVLAIAGVFFEVSPIKINPISCILSFIFKPVNKNIDSLRQEFEEKTGEISNEIGQMKEDQTVAKKDNDKNRFLVIRWEILSFRTDLNNGSLYTDNEYQHIFDDYDEYVRLHEKYPDFKNGYLDDAIKEIKDHYAKNHGMNTKYF